MQTFKRYMGGLLVMVLIFMTGFLMVPVKVLAATGTWVNDSTITFNGATYQDRTGDSSESLIKQGDPGLCVKRDTLPLRDGFEGRTLKPAYAEAMYKVNNVIRDINGSKTSANHIQLRAEYYSAKEAKVLSSSEFSRLSDVNPALDTVRCVEVAKESIDLKEGAAASAAYAWIDAGHIENTAGTRMYVNDGSGKFIWQADGNECQEHISNATTTGGTLNYDGSKNVTGVCSWKTKTVAVSSGSNMTKASGTGTSKNGQSTGVLTGEGSDRASCEVVGGNVLSWAICPVINGVAALSDWLLETIIVPFLEGIPITADTGSEMFQIWSSFRIIANIMLIGLLLAIAIAQGAGKT